MKKANVSDFPFMKQGVAQKQVGCGHTIFKNQNIRIGIYIHIKEQGSRRKKQKHLAEKAILRNFAYIRQDLAEKHVWRGQTHIRTKINGMPFYHLYLRNKVTGEKYKTIVLKKPFLRNLSV